MIDKSIWLIDDDEIFRFISLHQLKVYFPEANIMLFSNLLEAKAHLVETVNYPQIIILDLNFPDLNGQFLLEFMYQNISKVQLNEIIVYITSSSISDLDKNIVAQFPFVKKFVEKPLNEAFFEELQALVF